MKQIKIKYYSNEIDKLKKITYGDWIDLRSAETVELKAGEYKLISLGVGMELPNGYEGIIAPRSSTYKTWGIICANSIGIIDNSYCGEGDVWRFPVIALRDTKIEVNDRICQFRILKNQPTIEFKEVPFMRPQSRGGFGSTGSK